MNAICANGVHAYDTIDWQPLYQKNLQVQLHLANLATNTGHAINVNGGMNITDSASGTYAIDPSGEILMNDDNCHTTKEEVFIRKTKIGAVVKMSPSTRSTRGSHPRSEESEGGAKKSTAVLLNWEIRGGDNNMIIGMATAIVGGLGPRGRARGYTGAMTREKGAIFRVPIVIQRRPPKGRHGLGDPRAESIGVSDRVSKGSRVCHAMKFTQLRVRITLKVKVHTPVSPIGGG